MRLATFQTEPESRPRPGVVDDDGGVHALADLLGADAPTDMVEVIEQWDGLGARVIDALGSGAPTTTAEHLDQTAGWLPPVPRPSKIMGVALNNKALAALAATPPAHPQLFCYPTSALVGHRRPIEVREDYGLTHPEPELGVVIGRRTKDVSVGDALDAVFGYTVVDDVTSPELKAGDTVVIPRSQGAGMGAVDGKDGAPPVGFEHGDLHLTYHARSKGTDTFAPCGPWVVTADAIADPDDLAVSLHVDDELCTEDNTGNLMFSVADVVSHASRYFTLHPGDILHIGTAAQGKYRLRDLDYQQRVGTTRTIAIAGIGALVNPVARA